MSVTYSHPAGVAPSETERPVLSTPEGGYVAIDAGLMALWRTAAGRTLEEMLGDGPAHADVADIIAPALACLAEARLLTRTSLRASELPNYRAPEQPNSRADDATVGAVIVVSVEGELVWLEECVRALAAQQHALAAILVVDNAVGLDIRRWLDERRLTAAVHSLRTRTNYATALNEGCTAIARTDHVLILNADMKPAPSCVGHLIARATETPRTAAVAPKLLLWRAPAFLNGIGNRVPGWGWGTDNGMGQLDLGQLDGWSEVPSGCLGALLIARRALDDVGPFDTRYPLYYEDADWSFRARLLGYRIAAAPAAHLLHAFGASWTEGQPTALSMTKLQNAVVGRFRFAVKVPSRGRAALLVLHGLSDLSRNIAGAFKHADGATLAAFARAFSRVGWTLPETLLSRRRIQSRRAVADAVLFEHADDLTPSMSWQNLPLLTCQSIREYYAPLIRDGRTRPMPECPGARIEGPVPV